MHQPVESCRLYFALRNMAWCGTEPTPDAATGEVDADLETPSEFGMNEAETRMALEDLLEANLVHRIQTAEELEASDEKPPSGDRLFVEPLDDLMAATIILGS